jgi:hypothetical protein
MEIHSRVLCSSSKASELLTRVAQQQQQTQDAGGGPGRYADALLGASFLVHSGESFPDSSHMSQCFVAFSKHFPWGYPGLGFRNWPKSIYVSLYYVHI